MLKFLWYNDCSRTNTTYTDKQTATCIFTIHYYTLKYHFLSPLTPETPLETQPRYLKTPSLQFTPESLTPVTRHSGAGDSHNKAPLSLVCPLCSFSLSLSQSIGRDKRKICECPWMLFGIVVGGNTAAYKTYWPNEDVLTITSQIIISRSGYLHINIMSI